MTEQHSRIGQVTFKGNVRALQWVTMPTLPARAQPNTEVIKLVRDLSVISGSGRCQGLAVAWIDCDGQTYSTWAGADQYPASLLVGSMAILINDMAAKTNKMRGET